MKVVCVAPNEFWSLLQAFWRGTLERRGKYPGSNYGIERRNRASFYDVRYLFKFHGSNIFKILGNGEPGPSSEIYYFAFPCPARK